MNKRPDKSDNKKKKLLIALEKSLGVVSTACKMAKVGRDSFYRYYKEDAAFKATVDDIAEQGVDFAESQLFKLIAGHVLPEDKVFFRAGDTKPTIVKGKKHIGPDTAATIFYLKTKGKKRGYVERLDLTTDGKAINGGIDLTKLTTDELLMLKDLQKKYAKNDK